LTAKESVTPGTIIALDLRVRHCEARLDAARERWQRGLSQPRPMRSVLFALFEMAEAQLLGAIARRERARAELHGERHLKAVKP
jgi:hypothetical protein